MTGLTERLSNHRHVGDIRGRGLFQAIELVADRATKATFDPALKLNSGDVLHSFARAHFWIGAHSGPVSPSSGSSLRKIGVGLASGRPTWIGVDSQRACSRV